MNMNKTSSNATQIFKINQTASEASTDKHTSTLGVTKPKRRFANATKHKGDLLPSCFKAVSGDGDHLK